MGRRSGEAVEPRTTDSKTRGPDVLEAPPAPSPGCFKRVRLHVGVIEEQNLIYRDSQVSAWAAEQ